MELSDFILVYVVEFYIIYTIFAFVDFYSDIFRLPFFHLEFRADTDPNADPTVLEALITIPVHPYTVCASIMVFTPLLPGY